MAEDFDPYRKWLGIPPAEQPPDHYRLLGIGRFEDDPDTISNAADRQMTHVRTFQAGPHSAISQKLLNEIAAARVCLLNREKKTEYDAQLRARQAPPPVVTIMPVAAPASAVAPSARPMPVPSLGRGTVAKQKNSSGTGLVVAGALLFGAVLVVILLIVRRNPEQSPLVGEFTPNAHSADASKEIDATSPVSKIKNAPVPALEIIEAKWGKGDRWEDISERVRSLVYDERLVATAWGSVFLGLPDPAFGEAKQLRIRYKAAGEPRAADFGDGDFIYLDGHAPESREASANGLQVLDARYGAGSTWIDVLPRVSRWVHCDRLAVRVDLVVPNDPAPGARKALFLRYRTTDGEFVAHAWNGEELILDARPVSVAGKPVNLIEAANPRRDSAGGAWQKDAATLVAPEGQAGNLTIGSPFTDDYLLTAVVASEPRADDVGITLPVGERQVQLVVDGWSNFLSALQRVDGAMGPENPTGRVGNVFAPGQETTLRCAVRGSSIVATCNGRVIVDWRGDPRRLSPPDGTQAVKPSAIVLRGLQNPWRVKRLDVARLAPESSSTLSTRGKAIDLLKLIDVKLDAAVGEWQMTDKGLLSPGGQHVRLGIPFMPPDDYELRLVAERTSAGNEAFFIGLLVDGRQTSAALDGWGGKVRGLFGLDGKDANGNATTREGSVFVDERPKELICTVHPSSVHITCEGQVLIDWHGDARRFALPSNVPDELALYVGDWQTKYLISKLELRPLPPEPPEPPTDLAQPVDVLKRIDVKRDAVYGDWRKEENGLLAPGQPWQRLQLPVLPPEGYKLTMEVFGSRNVTVGIVVGARRVEGTVVDGRQVEVVLDGGPHGDASGLQMVNGKFGDQNSTTHRGKVLRDDGPNQIVCTVRQDRVEVVCNGWPVVDWQGDPSILSLPHESMVPDDRRLFLCCWDWPFRVTRLELSTPDAETALPKPAAPADEPRSLSDLVDKPSADKRLPVPDVKDLATADKKVSEMFDPQWKAAKKFADRLAVLRRLYDAGVATSDNPALRYALLREAGRRAADLADVLTACDAAEKLGLDFQIDPLAEKLRLLGEAQRRAHLASQSGTLALQALLLSDRALAEERFDEARKFASLAAAAGHRMHKDDVAGCAEARLARVRSRQEEHAKFEQAIERLKEQPDDAAANETAGIYFCLMRGDWKRGLPRLARSGKARLAEIARLEAVAGVDPKQRAALVDAWFAEAEERTGALGTECQLQAKYWYERGLLPEASTDATRKAALTKLASLPAISQARLVPGLDMAMFDGGDFQQFRARRVDRQICHNFGFGSPHPSLPGDNFSIRWTGWIKPPLPGKYIIKTTSDDSIRVRVNDKLVIDHWARGAGDDVAEVELTDELQPLSVEFNDYQVVANVCLSWLLKDFSDLQVVPPEALFHDPAVVP